AVTEPLRKGSQEYHLPLELDQITHIEEPKAGALIGRTRISRTEAFIDDVWEPRPRTCRIAVSGFQETPESRTHSHSRISVRERVSRDAIQPCWNGAAAVDRAVLRDHQRYVGMALDPRR